MEAVRPIEFTDALAHLQALLGSRVRVLLNVHGSFCGCGFDGELSCVQTLPPTTRRSMS